MMSNSPPQISLDVGTIIQYGPCRGERLTAFRIRYVVGLDEALKPALPASTLRLAVGLILGARHAAYGTYFVDGVEGMPACGEPM